MNAIRRLAAVVVKKSLQEGFGLGVTEAMWKARPVVASAVGGHLEQVQHRHGGLLVEDPADIGAFGDAIVELLQEPQGAARLGQAARERARALFLNDRHFVRWVEVFGSALEPRPGPPRSMGPAAGVPAHPWSGTAALDRGDRDAVTGLWNRRPFETELDRARQNAERLALLSIDVDRYNDVIQRHGAAAAQQLIQAIAHVLAERLRPDDTLARMGGDEFAAVFRHATPPADPEPGRRALHGRARVVPRHRHRPDSCHHQHRRRIVRRGHADAPRSAARRRHRPPPGQGRGRRPRYRARAPARRLAQRRNDLPGSSPGAWVTAL